MRLLGIEPKDIPDFLQEHINDARALERELIELTWYMRGGITLDQAFMMTSRQRKYAFKFIEQNIERTNKSGIMMH